MVEGKELEDQVSEQETEEVKVCILCWQKVKNSGSLFSWYIFALITQLTPLHTKEHILMFLNPIGIIHSPCINKLFVEQIFTCTCE